MSPTAVTRGARLVNLEKRAMLLSALYAAQERYGYLSEEAILDVAAQLDLPPGFVHSTASFYSLFRLQPQGTYVIQVCRGLSCYLVDGAENVAHYISRKLGIQPGETTPDGRFTLEMVECLAACGSAPALRVNDELYEHMTPDAIDHLLDRLGGDES
ncbi:MAG TPA: NAD(P)H-dependent oxidoreductase subunit E [Anaerolineae bacterium]|nr:NAD(P)H-dependent oxidoreductase subunit E [Anaerolineae bacterium]HIQ05285.1 NAD(P)H-dependent oxidoreductase subunit E [Anaerolineae bacterium]